MVRGVHGPRGRVFGAAAAAVVATVSVAGAAHAQTDRPEPKSPAAARAIAEIESAVALINEADAHVRETRERCRYPTAPTIGGVTHDAPSAAVTGALAALRRPQSPTDVVASRSLTRSFVSGDTVYADYTRTVTAADGTQFVIVPARMTPPKPRPASCEAAVRARLTRLARAKGRRQLRVALREYDELRRNRPTAKDLEPFDEVLLFTRTPDGGLGSGGGGGRFWYFLTHGNLGTSGSGRSSTITGLLPDGVASITMTFPKRVSRGRYYKPKVFRRKVVVTAPVRENVFTVRVPRAAPDAFPSRAVWRGPDGHVVRVVRG